MVEVKRRNDNVTLLPAIAILNNEDEHPRATQNLLPPELRANFDALRSLQLCSEEQRRSTQEEEDECRSRKRNKTGHQNLVIPDSETETNSDNDHDDNDKAYGLAVSTYCMIESEISRMKNGIAELEALLLATEDAETEQHDNFDSGTVVSDSEY